MQVSIGHPTDRANFSVVQVGCVTLWFSYQTCIGFCDTSADDGGRVVACENRWGPTTGKHLNFFSDKADRVGITEFASKLSQVFEESVQLADA